MMTYPPLIAAGLLTGLVALPALAHEVQVSKDVGATLHIEPNDIALAGTPTDVWFALTKAGGAVIPLDDCECRLTLYDGQANVIEEPVLIPISAEGFNEIPGATVTFPEIGVYELRLQGLPKAGVQFTPFELSFETTVAGRAKATPAAASVEEEPSSDSNTAADSAVNAPDAETPENGSETAVAQSEETSAPASASNPWTSVMVWGGAVLAIGIVGGLLGGLRSPGGKP